jgi:hypothetical protein
MIEYIADYHVQCRLSYLHACNHANGSIRVHNFLDDDFILNRLYTLSNLDGYYGYVFNLSHIFSSL